MALVTITEASKLTGKARKTLYAHLKKGKLSSCLQRDGSKQIDTSELIRVYGELKHEVTEVTPQSVPEETPSNVTYGAVETLVAAIETMRQQQELDRKENVLLRKQLLELTDTVKQLTNRIEYKPAPTDSKPVKLDTKPKIKQKKKASVAQVDSSGKSNYLDIPVFGQDQ